ncbi:MAG TPA: hypothetical protein VG456_03440 [Candidatus Sulfopaludibacter sp.]|nr:hypothetical protein [Candidatus Sulfopaludibacter sp.]
MARLKPATKSRLDPQQYVIPGEDPEDFRKLAEEMIETHQPGDVCERFMVDQMVVNEWRLRRYERILPHVRTIGTEKDVSRLEKLIASIKRNCRRSEKDLKKMKLIGQPEVPKTKKRKPLDSSLPPSYYIN